MDVDEDDVEVGGDENANEALTREIMEGKEINSKSHV